MNIVDAWSDNVLCDAVAALTGLVPRAWPLTHFRFSRTPCNNAQDQQLAGPMAGCPYTLHPPLLHTLLSGQLLLDQASIPTHLSQV